MTALLGGVATAGVALARSTPTHAQQTPKMPIVGFLHPGSSDSGSPVFDALGQGLRDVGYVEGENVKIEARWARGNPDTLPQLTRELIQLHSDVLVATARPSIEAARAATSDLPIVANDLESHPVASGYVASLAHPGGNLTGLFLDAPTLCGKWLQQLKNRRSLGFHDGHVSAWSYQGRGNNGICRSCGHGVSRQRGSGHGAGVRP